MGRWLIFRTVTRHRAHPKKVPVLRLEIYSREGISRGVELLFNSPRKGDAVFLLKVCGQD